MNLATVAGVHPPDAYVVAAAGETVDPRDLLAHCRTRLAGHTCPREIVLVDELPTGLGGEVRRRLL